MLADLNIYRNKKKTRNLLLMSAGVCVILGLTFIYGLGVFDAIFKAKVAAVSGILCLFMLILLFKSVADLNDKSPIIALTKETGNGKTAPLPKALGEFFWKDVQAIDKAKIGGDTLVVVNLINAEYYKTKLSKMFFNMAYDKNTNELHVSYSASEIDMTIDELYKTFVSYWKESQVS
ncbi:STM3941 family protein [Sphingobacterium sp. MYb382]|uniref:STM3941 family protein n=1 Tax=Sphingobacterium sp. MYb382 TaxID=2745278 RepID=UPI00309C3D51